MGDGDTLTETRRTQSFAGEQTVEDSTAGNPLVAFEQHANLLENALFAARLKIENDVFKDQ
jgi:hypothetical protein